MVAHTGYLVFARKVELAEENFKDQVSNVKELEEDDTEPGGDEA
jgi:hypothetical protein